MFTSFPVLLDACVLVPNWLRHVLLTAADFELYRPRWSATILGEVRRTLVGKIGIGEEDADYTLGEMTRAFPEAAVVGYESVVDGMPVNAKDRHVLAAALVGHAQIIVTNNLKDFPERLLAPFGIEAVTADSFLMDLLARYPEDIRDVLQFIADNSGKKGKSVLSLRDLANRVQATAKNFAAAAIMLDEMPP